MTKTQKRRLQRKRAKLNAKWNSYVKSDSFIILNYYEPEVDEKHVITDYLEEANASEIALRLFGSVNSSEGECSTGCFTLQQLEYLDHRFERMLWVKKTWRTVQYCECPHSLMVRLYYSKFNFCSPSCTDEEIYLLEYKEK